MDAINAFLGRGALVHPDHPFRKPDDSGAELWMGENIRVHFDILQAKN